MNKAFRIFLLVILGICIVALIYWATIDITEPKNPETQIQGSFTIEEKYSEFIIMIDECNKIITIDMEILLLDGWTLNIINE